MREWARHRETAIVITPRSQPQNLILDLVEHHLGNVSAASVGVEPAIMRPLPVTVPTVIALLL